MKTNVKFLLLVTVAILIFALSFVAYNEADAREDNTSLYEIYEFLEAHNRYPKDWGSDIQLAKYPGSQIFFEDGSWVYNEYSGCVTGWPCTQKRSEYSDLHCEVEESEIMEYSLVTRYCSNLENPMLRDYQPYYLGRDGDEVIFTYLSLESEVFVSIPFVLR